MMSDHKLGFDKACSRLWHVHPKPLNKVLEPFFIPNLRPIIQKTLNIEPSSQVLKQRPLLHPEVFEPFIPQTLKHHPKPIGKRSWTCLHPEVFEPFMPQTLKHDPKPIWTCLLLKSLNALSLNQYPKHIEKIEHVFILKSLNPFIPQTLKHYPKPSGKNIEPVFILKSLNPSYHRL